MPAHHLPIIVYYEDTDFSGVVYHANYLKYFERSREHMLGIQALARLYKEDGLGFVVYKIEMTFRRPAVHADELVVRSFSWTESPLRIVFDQSVWRGEDPKPLVKAQIELACVNRQGHPKLIPGSVLKIIEQFSPAPIA